ncbi:MAG: hypothetical protein ABL989_14805 [Gammaproteobacteria bacterium]
MNVRNLDWTHLRQGLVGPALLLLACAAAWGATTAYRSRTDAALQEGRQSLASLEAERNELTERREARRKFAQLFQQLSVDGVVGAEQRLAWVQATRDAGSELHLPYLRYTTSPQRAFEAAWLVPGVAAPVLVSQMDLQLGLVHELDLLRLLARLREAPGLLQVQACNLEMPGTGAALLADKANLTGSCQLALYSIPRESALAAANPES